MTKKRVPVTELHRKPRKQNPEAKRRVTVVLQLDLVNKLKVKAIESGETLQRYLANLLTKHLGD